MRAKRPDEPAVPLGLLGGAALATWVVPGLLAACLGGQFRYQRGSAIGLVYLQVVGVGMANVWLMGALRGKARRSDNPVDMGSQRSHWPVFACLLVGANFCVAMITFDINQHIVDIISNRPAAFARQMIEAALDHGLGEEVPSAATIYVSHFHPWLFGGAPEGSALVAQHLGRKVHVVNGRPLPSRPTLREQLRECPPPAFAMNDFTQDGRSGYVILSSVEEACDLRGEPRYGAREFRVFVQGDAARPGGTLDCAAVLGDSFALDGDPCIPMSAVKLVPLRCGDGWAIFAGHFSRPVSVASMQLQPSPDARQATGLLR